MNPKNIVVISYFSDIILKFIESCPMRYKFARSRLFRSESYLVVK